MRATIIVACKDIALTGRVLPQLLLAYDGIYAMFDRHTNAIVVTNNFVTVRQKLPTNICAPPSAEAVENQHIHFVSFTKNGPTISMFRWMFNWLSMKFDGTSFVELTDQTYTPIDITVVSKDCMAFIANSDQYLLQWSNKKVRKIRSAAANLAEHDRTLLITVLKNKLDFTLEITENSINLVVETLPYVRAAFQ